MSTLSVLISLVLLPNLNSFPHEKTSGFHFPQIVQGLEKLAGRIEGRLLGCLVHQGMNEEQVDEILGADQSRLESVGEVGGVTICHRRFYTYGITVSYITDTHAVLRVDHVSFWPIFN